MAEGLTKVLTINTQAEYEAAWSVIASDYDLCGTPDEIAEVDARIRTLIIAHPQFSGYNAHGDAGPEFSEVHVRSAAERGADELAAGLALHRPDVAHQGIQRLVGAGAMVEIGVNAKPKPAPKTYGPEDRE